MRDAMLAEETGARVHICHVSTARSVDIIRKMKKKGVPITCETCPQYFTLTEDEVLTQGAMARVIRLQVDTGEDHLGLFSGDGVVVATPTGSTGYSLSAGGPIVEPTAQNFVISPICAHTVFSKSFVLSAAGTVTVAPADKNRKQVYLSVDGGKAFSLRAGDKVRISRSRYETELVRLTDRSIYEVLRTKMTGGIGHEE